MMASKLMEFETKQLGMSIYCKRANQTGKHVLPPELLFIIVLWVTWSQSAFAYHVQLVRVVFFSAYSLVSLWFISRSELASSLKWRIIVVKSNGLSTHQHNTPCQVEVYIVKTLGLGDKVASSRKFCWYKQKLVDESSGRGLRYLDWIHFYDKLN